MNINDTLTERGKRYGEFVHHARIAQHLQDVMRNADGWSNLASDQKQALTVIADKIARILNGDPTYIDNWHDIIGYAKLVETRLLRDMEPKVQAAPATQREREWDAREAPMKAGYGLSFTPSVPV